MRLPYLSLPALAVLALGVGAGCAASVGADFTYDPQVCAETALRRRPDPAVLPGGAEGLARDCSMGDAGSCSIAGVMYELGRGVPRDAARARALYLHACRAGNARGCSNLAELMLQEGGVAPERALGILESACDRGQGRACATLGRIHREGAHVPASAPKALGYFERACQRGDAIGCRSLAEEVAQRGEPQRALELFVLACTHGDEAACARLGTSQESGAPRKTAHSPLR